jgi:hypothetical protein
MSPIPRTMVTYSKTKRVTNIFSSDYRTWYPTVLRQGVQSHTRRTSSFNKTDNFSVTTDTT